MPKTIGVLALQGGYAAHCRALKACGIESLEVRRAQDLAQIDGLVLPGGESTTQIKLLRRFELWNPLDAYVRSGAPVLATCAGMILAAKQVSNPAQDALGWMDIHVERNGWGRQVHSGEAMADPGSTSERFGSDPLPLLFIRAPRIKRIGDAVKVLATLKGEAVMVQEANVVAASFHPELTTDLRVHHTVFSN